MTQLLSVALANAMAQVVAGNLANGTLAFYAGDPASGGTLLSSGQLPIAPFGSPSNGTISLAGQWFATVSVAGTITNARISDPTNTYWMDFTVGLSGSGANIIIGQAAVVVNAVVSVSAFSYTVPTT